jgi:hypothetical protein
MTTRKGASAGPWRIEEVLKPDAPGDDTIVQLTHESTGGAIYSGEGTLAELIAALMTYLDIDRIEATE